MRGAAWNNVLAAEDSGWRCRGRVAWRVVGRLYQRSRVSCSLGQVRSGREAVVIGKCIKDKTARVDDMAGDRLMCNRATAATPRIWKELKEPCSS